MLEQQSCHGTKEGISGNRLNYTLISQLSVTVKQVAVVATGFY